MNKKVLSYIMVGAPLILGAYFVIKYLKGNKSGTGVIEDTTTTTTQSSKTFPLKKGVNGAKVKELQEAIMAYDASLLPKFKADSNFGSETEAALVKLLNKKIISSQDDIAKILAMGKSVKSSQQLEVVNKGRLARAQELISKWNTNQKLNFYAANEVQYKEGSLTILKTKDSSITAGFKIDSVVTDSGGYLTINAINALSGNIKIQISSYAVYLK
jgi:hypothetical protein